jgi:disulfide bond formation protein DsbB
MFMFGLAWWKKDRNVLPYSFILSVVGFAIAVYHHMLQIGYNIYKPCSTAPFAVDCAKPSFVEFGFVTFPFMAVVLFAFILLIIVTATKISQRS